MGESINNLEEIKQKCDSCGRTLVVSHAGDAPIKLIAFHCPCGHSTKTQEPK